MTIPVLFENNDYIIINKPSGLVVHPYDYSTEYTLLDFLHEKLSEIFFGNNIITLQDKRIINLGGIVHKLDRDTSGVMVIAKKEEIFKDLQEQFRNHKINKLYIALVEGNIEKDVFTIDAPLGRSKKDYKQSTNPENPRGELRSAITDVHVLKRNKITTLVELSPKTGRTHQLRAHMSSIGHPIIGDKIYGSITESPRIMLHAHKLSFMLNKKEYTFEAEIPNEFL